MDFSLVVETFVKMEKTASRLALTDYLVELLKRTPPQTIDKVTYLIQGKLYPDYEGVELGIAGRMVMRAIANASGADTARIEEIYRRTGDLGDTAGEALLSKSQSTFFSEPMTVERVYAVLDRIARTAGAGSQESKLRLLQSLLNDASNDEARYIVKFVLGQLRLGIADYTMLDSLALAFTADKANRNVLEHAYNVSSDLGAVARTLAIEGLDAVVRMKVTLYKPIRPMLAERAVDANEVVSRSEGRPVALEYKLDGERVQVHKGLHGVELFSRRLERITGHYPDVASSASTISTARELILEGEVVAIDSKTAEYLPFQELMHRRRKHGVEEAMQSYPVVINFFDVLYADGKSMLDSPYSDRRSLLEKLLRNSKDRKIKVVEQRIAKDQKQIENFMAEAMRHGCEGLMAKQLESTYRAGAREYAWMKLKREYQNELVDTLDLVIVGALYGRGRRVGSYGALLLAAYDEENDIFRSVSKVGTGFSDKDLVKFYSILQEHIVKHRPARVDSGLEMDVWFEPKLVIEVIASEITLSPLHTAAMDTLRAGYGLALRFPKFTGKVRDDKKPEDATTISEIVEMYEKQLKKSGAKRG
ncbi:MAG: ATP-dependent DNA ligase [Nitrososphaera sp.]|jgi:DNA ligase-1